MQVDCHGFDDVRADWLACEVGQAPGVPMLDTIPEHGDLWMIVAAVVFQEAEATGAARERLLPMLFQDSQ